MNRIYKRGEYKAPSIIFYCIFQCLGGLENKKSPNFGSWVGTILSAENKRQLWIPEGFAHGFVVISEQADLLYKTTDYWHPECERAIAWNDPQLGIAWPIQGEVIVSARDAAASLLKNAEVFP